MQSRRRRRSAPSSNEEIPQAQPRAEASGRRWREMRKPIGLAALLVAATLLVYAQVAGFDFVTLDEEFPNEVNASIEWSVSVIDGRR